MLDTSNIRIIQLDNARKYWLSQDTQTPTLMSMFKKMNIAKSFEIDSILLTQSNTVIDE